MHKNFKNSIIIIIFKVGNNNNDNNKKTESLKIGNISHKEVKKNKNKVYSLYLFQYSGRRIMI